MCAVLSTSLPYESRNQVKVPATDAVNDEVAPFEQFWNVSKSIEDDQRQGRPETCSNETISLPKFSSNVSRNGARIELRWIN